MGLLDLLKTSVFGLGGATPETFGNDPANSLHNEYSTIGKPNSRWKSLNGATPLPQPSKLDINDSKDTFKSSYKYSDHKPQ